MPYLSVKNPHKRRSAVWWLVLVQVLLVLYASLYPFHPWQDKGLLWYGFMDQDFPPRYVSHFDVLVNFLGYFPLGFCITLAVLRGGGRKLPSWALLLGVLGGGILSLCMESLQNFLPERVASHADWLLNTCGGTMGATTAWILGKVGAIDFWADFRANWFVADAQKGLVLLLLWPLALLYPLPMPWALGQVYESLKNQMESWAIGTPFAAWIPVHKFIFLPQIPQQITLMAALGLWVPCLLAYSIIPARKRRLVLAVGVFIFGVMMTALSNAVRMGPQQAWDWFWPPVQIGLVVAFGLAILSLWLSRWQCNLIALAALITHVFLVNSASVSPYFDWDMKDALPAQLLRFYGVTQWFGWLWPYALLLYLLFEVWYAVLRLAR